MFLILLAAAATAGPQPAPKIQALIVTGQNQESARKVRPQGGSETRLLRLWRAPLHRLSGCERQ